MKIRRFSNIEKDEYELLNESFDFSDDNDGIEETIESSKLLSTFDDLCWKLLDSFYQFISVHYGDPEWFSENYYGYEYFSMNNDKLPFVDSEVYLTKYSYSNKWKLYFTGKFSKTAGFSDKSRIIVFEIPSKENSKYEFMPYNKMIAFLDEARTSRNYNVVLKWIDESNRSAFFHWSAEAGINNIQCVRDYVNFCNDYINTFIEAAKTPYKDIDKVRDLEGYKKKFTDLLYNFFTWLDINGKYPTLTGRRRGFKFDFKEYGIPHMVLLGSNIFFTKNPSAAELDGLDTMIHVNGMSNPRDYWAEALKALGKFEFSWGQVCLEGGSTNIFYEIGAAIEKFLEDEKSKMRSLKESFDFENDDDNIESAIENIKASRALVDFLDEMEDLSVRMNPDEAIRKLNSFVNAYSDGGYQVELKYDENDNETHGYWINIRKNALFKSFFILPNGARLMKRYAGMENIARCVMWICACLFKEMNKEVMAKIEDYGKKYRFNPVFFDFESTKDRVSRKYFPYLNESFDFDSDDEDDYDMVKTSLEKCKKYRNLDDFNKLVEKYIRNISWKDVNDIARRLEEMCKNDVPSQKFSIRMEEKDSFNKYRATKTIILTRLSDGKEFESGYTKYDADNFSYVLYYHFLHLVCIVGTCLFGDLPNWWKTLVETAQEYGINLQKDSVDIIYQSYFEMKE